jgi:hypothetical protein
MEKQKLNEELSRIREIMSITLKESNSSLKKNIELDIEERVAGKNIGNIVDLANDFQSLNPLYKGMFDDLESAIKLQQNPIKIVDKTTKKVTNLNTSEDIFNAIKNNSLTSTELGRVEKGFLKSTNTPKPLRKSIVVDFVIDPAVLKDLGKVPGGKTNDIKKYLKSKGYADDSINEIITQLKSNGKIDKSGNFVGSVKPKPVDPNTPDPNTPNPNQTPDPKWWEKLKTIGWKKALLAAGVAGVSGLLLWYLFKQEGTNPEDMEETPPIDPNNEWAPCLSNILSKKQGRVDKLKSGTLVVKVKNTTYPDGVLFFADGKVLTNDGKKKGTWKCKSGTAVVSEQSTGNNLSIDAESVVNSLKGNVITTMGLESIQNILNKYIKSGQGKQFLDTYKKISGEFLEKTLISKTTITDPSKRAIRDRIYGKIRTIKGSGGTSTGDSLSGIEITWDDEKKEGGDKIPVKKDNYIDCPSFPLRFGCKGPLVSELQTCLKMTGVDGKLGPKTKATAETWAQSKGITLTIPTGGSGGNVDGQVVFGVTEDNFKRICGVEPVPVRIEPDPEPVANVDGPVVNPTTIPEKPTNSDVRKKSDEELGFEIYNRIKDDFRNKDYFGRRRLVYSGPDLSDNEQNLLTKYLNLQGYALTDDIEKKEGEKLVYKKIKEKK